MLHLYSAANPRRPVNWRWERARAIREGGHPLSRGHDDEWVAKALRFRQAYDACTNEVDYALLAHRHPAVYWAHELWQGADLDGGNPFKSELEARILAGDTPEHTALRLATTPPVVEAYEKLFFNVVERLVSRGYLVHQVMGPAVYLGLHEQEYDVVWKLFAVMGGPLVLDLVIDTFAGASRPADPADLIGFLIDATELAIRRKSLIAAHTVRVNNFTAIELIAQFLKLMEIERMAGRGPAGSQVLLDSIGMMLKSLPIQVGGRPCGANPTMLDVYNESGAELRHEELLAVGLGREIPVQAVLERYAYPPLPVQLEEPAAARTAG